MREGRRWVKKRVSKIKEGGRERYTEWTRRDVVVFRETMSKKERERTILVQWRVAETMTSNNELQTRQNQLLILTSQLNQRRQ